MNLDFSVASSHMESDVNKNSCETNHEEALVKPEQEPQSGIYIMFHHCM